MINYSLAEQISSEGIDGVALAFVLKGEQGKIAADDLHGPETDYLKGGGCGEHHIGNPDVGQCAMIFI